MEMEKADAKNALEEYVYEMRDKLSEQYQQFVTEQVSRMETWEYLGGTS